MSSVVISGNTSGAITLSAPDVAGTNTITLPASTGYLFVTPTAGTLATSAGGTGLTSFTSGGAMYATSTSALTTGTLPVASGGTGATSATAYAVQCGGTTSTSAHQSVASLGSSGQVLTSQGAGALPTWTTISATPTTAQVQSAMAGSATGDLGTFALLYTNSASTYNAGATLSASSLYWSTADADQNGQPSGTWRISGWCYGGGGRKQTSVWFRIS